MKIRDRVIWITGASSGIGEALVHELDRRGARLILSSRNVEALERVRGQCANGGARVKIVPLDLNDLAGMPDKAREALALFGRVDILVNNGGIGQRSTVLETDVTVDERVLRVNYLGPVALTKAILPSMIDSHSGHIVVISSLAGKIGSPGRSAYSASKHALHGFFDALRGEHARDGIRVTMICPGWVQTNFRANALRGDGAPRGREADAYRNAITADACARAIVRAIERDQEEVYLGKLALAIYAQRLFPRLFARVMRRAFKA